MRYLRAVRRSGTGGEGSGESHERIIAVQLAAGGGPRTGKSAERNGDGIGPTRRSGKAEGVLDGEVHAGMRVKGQGREGGTIVPLDNVGGEAAGSIAQAAADDAVSQCIGCGPMPPS